MIYWYITKISNIINSSKNIRLLYVAPEKNLQKILKPFSHIECISGYLNLLMNCDIRIDITDMNFEDNFFDVIICNHVLEHIVDYRKAMRELFRVLRLKGFTILQVPISKKTKETFEDFSITSPEERERYFGQKDHVRIYGKDYKERLESVGFKVELYDIQKDLNIKEAKKPGLNEEDILYVTDVVDLYFKAIENIEEVKGQAVNIGGGIENSFSLIELFDILEKELGVKMNYKKIPWRKSDQKVFVSDNSRAKEKIKWRPEVDKKEGMRNILKGIRVLYN